MSAKAIREARAVREQLRQERRARSTVVAASVKHAGASSSRRAASERAGALALPAGKKVRVNAPEPVLESSAESASSSGEESEECAESAAPVAKVAKRRTGSVVASTPVPLTAEVEEPNGKLEIVPMEQELLEHEADKEGWANCVYCCEGDGCDGCPCCFIESSPLFQAMYEQWVAKAARGELDSVAERMGDGPDAADPLDV